MINKVILVGRVGKDPDVRHLDNNVSVARVTLATNETYKNKNGEKVTNTEWHNIVAWRSQADLIEKYVKKGSMLYVEGKIRTRSWDDKEGIKRYTTEIDIDTIQLLSARQDESNSSGNTSYSQSNVNTPSNSSSNHEDDMNITPTDDLPF